MSTFPNRQAEPLTLIDYILMVSREMADWMTPGEEYTPQDFFNFFHEDPENLVCEALRVLLNEQIVVPAPLGDKYLLANTSDDN